MAGSDAHLAKASSSLIAGYSSLKTLEKIQRHNVATLKCSKNQGIDSKFAYDNTLGLIDTLPLTRVQQLFVIDYDHYTLI